MKNTMILLQAYQKRLSLCLCASLSLCLILNEQETIKVAEKRSCNTETLTLLNEVLERQNWDTKEVHVTQRAAIQKLQHESCIVSLKYKQKEESATSLMNKTQVPVTRATNFSCHYSYNNSIQKVV